MGTCEITALDQDLSHPRRTISRQTARCACHHGQAAGTARAKPACVDGNGSAGGGRCCPVGAHSTAGCKGSWLETWVLAGAGGCSGRVRLPVPESPFSVPLPPPPRHLRLPPPLSPHNLTTAPALRSLPPSVVTKLVLCWLSSCASSLPPSPCPSFHPSTPLPFIPLSFHPFPCPSLHPLIPPSIHTYIRPFIYTSLPPCIHSSITPPLIPPSFPLSLCSSLHPSVHPFIPPAIHPSLPPSTSTSPLHLHPPKYPHPCPPVPPAARLIASRQWCGMEPCEEGEHCALLRNRSGWSCTRKLGRIKTITVSCPLPRPLCPCSHLLGWGETEAGLGARWGSREGVGMLEP